MNRPYLVELRISAVVMADDDLEALAAAECKAREIVSDGGLVAEGATEIVSLAQLRHLDPAWDGDCIPYGADNDVRLKELVPAETPVKDTKSMDMFKGDFDV